MTIKATIKNYDSVVKLAMLLWPDSEHDALKLEMRETLADENAVIFLYLRGDKAIGFAHCQLRNDYVEGTMSSPVGYLEGIYVKETHRKQGIAAELLGNCQTWAKQRGCKEFASDCEIENVDSLAFHLRSGFMEANRIICFTKKL